MKNNGYWIPHHNMPWLEEIFEKLAKKARKLNAGKVGFEVLETKYEVQKDGTVDVRYLVRPYGESPKLDGWRLAATLQHEDSGNVIRAVPGMEIPKKYRETKPLCEHCKQRRYRKDTYIVVHDNGVFKQVGRSCLRDFLGGTSPDALVAFASAIVDMELYLEEAKGRAPIGEYRRPLSRDMLLEYVAQIAIEDGRYIGTSGGDASTLRKAMEQIFPPVKKPKGWRKIKVTEEARKLVAAAMEWARKEFADEKSRTDYQHNLMVVLDKIALEHRDLGIAASLIGAYKRHLLKQKRSADQLKNSQHVGKIGERKEFELELVFVTAFGTAFGYMNLYKFVDHKGNVFIWKTQKDLEIEVGDRIRMVATVKNHTEYNGVKQTELTRCSVSSKINQ